MILDCLLYRVPWMSVKVPMKGHTHSHLDILTDKHSRHGNLIPIFSFFFSEGKPAKVKSVIKQGLDQWDQETASKCDVLTVVYLTTVYVPSKTEWFVSDGWINSNNLTFYLRHSTVFAQVITYSYSSTQLIILFLCFHIEKRFKLD